MTEAEWLACEDAVPMLIFLKKKVSARKMRLFVLACVNTVEAVRSLQVLSGMLDALVSF
ncbi:hypothetical protein R5W23_002512 [Gemmata sp. JC673]|uniref:Uncharacterized protein n=1 Tax=Gemmata algarum TaxID=2975278 RepID=A0ABU5F345_9BACT|nr:hypothetical protein [Gemmata algarum]MDY3561237.1 hypothetical protein [Gemmata algarum]